MTNPYLSEILTALKPSHPVTDGKNLSVSGNGDLPSWFGVTDLAAASIGAAALMLRDYAEPDQRAAVNIDRRLASIWFGMTLRPTGWETPPPWDPIAGDYRSKDGWIRLHTNAPHHRAAALSVLGQHEDREALQPIVSTWESEELETAIVDAGGCAATMRDLNSWSRHQQGSAVAKEPLIHWKQHPSCDPEPRQPVAGRPLAGIRVLDLTRVLAGPVAGRFLAAFGADVLRIDPPGWDEPGVVPEVTVGKRCAGLDLKNSEDRGTFEHLLAGADVLLHGYRPDALDNLGYGSDAVRGFNPGLIDVCLNAYGWSGPWSGRRGFDSLIQMSSGIADYGMRTSGADKPVPLPVQALDHATGYLMAASVLLALAQKARFGRVSSARLSLARTAHLLSKSKRDFLATGIAGETISDIDPSIEKTDWGPARRVRFPVEIAGFEPAFDHPAGRLRSSEPRW